MVLAPAGSLLVAGIGEMVLSDDPSHALVAYGLGSCVALSIWDPRTKASALAHFMLPSAPAGGPPVKSVERGFPVFLEAFATLGGNLRRSQFKAAGGAAMLALTAGSLEIGRRNTEAVGAALTARGLRLAAADVGGKVGRTVQLEVGTGRLLIKSVAEVTVI